MKFQYQPHSRDKLHLEDTVVVVQDTTTHGGEVGGAVTVQVEVTVEVAVTVEIPEMTEEVKEEIAVAMAKIAMADAVDGNITKI